MLNINVLAENYNMSKLRLLSGMVDQSTYEACKKYGGGNSGVGMRLLLEEGIATKIDNIRLQNEALERLLGAADLMSDVSVAMRSDQNLLMNLLQALLENAKDKELN